MSKTHVAATGTTATPPFTDTPSQVRPAAPVRGSRYQPVFPAAIAAIWKRPTPALVEIGWRWIGSLPLLLFCLHLWSRFGPQLQSITAPLSNLSAFQPVESVRTLGSALDIAWELLEPALLPALPLCLAAWLVIAALGRTIVLRLLSRRIQPAASAGKTSASAPLAYKPLGSLMLFGARALALAALYALWAAANRLAVRWTVLTPSAHGAEPHIVGFAALSVSAALILFSLWCALSWPLQLAQTLILREGVSLSRSLRDAGETPRRLRNELIEVNLVMGIVRLALLILLVVLSACPLPFESVETTGFLVWWNAAAVVLWLIASDFFHAVRQAIVIRLVRTWSTLLDA